MCEILTKCMDSHGEVWWKGMRWMVGRWRRQSWSFCVFSLRYRRVAVGRVAVRSRLSIVRTDTMTFEKIINLHCF